MVKPIGFECRAFRLPLRMPLTTAHGEIRERHGFWWSLLDSEGHVGLGEAAPLPGFGLESLPESRRALESAGRRLCATSFAGLEDALDEAERATQGAPCARAAVDAALHDLAARRAGLSVAHWLARERGCAPRAAVGVAALLRERDPAALQEEARAAVAAGYPALKLKLDARAAPDLRRAAAVREVCPETVELRLDANAAWTEEEALRHLQALAPLRPAYVEQPVASAEALARLCAVQPVPLAIDEALPGPDALRGVAADVWVIKPAVAGGLRAAGRLAEAARTAGAAVVIGGFLDSAVGASAALALAASLPGSRPAGLDPVLARDLDLAPQVVSGAMRPAAGPGLGVRLP